MASIMAVDDSVAIRALMKLVLGDAGHKVVVFENGRLALDFAQSNSVDLVITDLNMPEMGGMSLVSNLRKMDTYKSIPILLITTETATYKKEKAKSIGVTGWIAKPVDKVRLLKAVEKCIG